MAFHQEGSQDYSQLLTFTKIDRLKPTRNLMRSPVGLDEEFRSSDQEQSGQPSSWWRGYGRSFRGSWDEPSPGSCSSNQQRGWNPGRLPPQTAPAWIADGS